VSALRRRALETSLAALVFGLQVLQKRRKTPSRRRASAAAAAAIRFAIPTTTITPTSSKTTVIKVPVSVRVVVIFIIGPGVDTLELASAISSPHDAHQQAKKTRAQHLPLSVLNSFEANARGLLPQPQQDSKRLDLQQVNQLVAQPANVNSHVLPLIVLLQRLGRQRHGKRKRMGRRKRQKVRVERDDLPSLLQSSLL